MNIAKYLKCYIFVDNCETSSKIVESQTTLNKIDSEIVVANSSGHWLDSMLDDDE